MGKRQAPTIAELIPRAETGLARLRRVLIEAELQKRAEMAESLQGAIEALGEGLAEVRGILRQLDKAGGTEEFLRSPAAQKLARQLERQLRVLDRLDRRCRDVLGVSE